MASKIDRGGEEEETDAACWKTSETQAGPYRALEVERKEAACGAQGMRQERKAHT